MAPTPSPHLTGFSEIASPEAHVERRPGAGDLKPASGVEDSLNPLTSGRCEAINH